MQFAVLGYAITSMETETYRPARLILLGEDASPQLRRSASLDALVTPASPPFFIWHTAEDPYVPPEHTYRFASALAAGGVPHAVHVFATARTALAWPKTLARLRSGPRWRTPGSTNRPACQPSGQQAFERANSDAKRAPYRSMGGSWASRASSLPFGRLYGR